MQEKALNFRLLDWDKRFVDSLNNDQGFLIDTSINYAEYLNSDKIENMKKIFSIDSIFSYKFGMPAQIDTNDHTLYKMYTCRCHATYGVENVHKVCPKCGTKVRHTIPFRYGWMDLHKHRILHPYLCKLLFSTKRGGDDNKKRKKKGRDDDTMSIGDMITKKKLNYTWAQLLNSRQALDDFMSETFSKDSTAYKLYQLLDNVYVTKIPVISTDYRPLTIKRTPLGIPEITTDTLNNLYMNISSSIRSLNTDLLGLSYNIYATLGSIMQDIATISDINLLKVSGGKKALVRGTIFSRRFKFSGRLVLEAIIDNNTSNDVYRCDVCQIPIDFFRGVFTEDIDAILETDYPQVTIEQKYRMLNPDESITNEEKQILREIFSKIGDPNVYINREPAVYKTSALGLRIHSLTDDEYSVNGKELVIRIPFFLLPAIAGDFKFRRWSLKSV